MPLRPLFYAPVFRLLERLGLHVTPNHYHFPIPDTSRLPESLWTRRSDLRGIDLDPDGQLRLLERLLAEYGKEWSEWPRTAPTEENGFFLENGHFETVDAEIYYGLTRARKPRRILEIGCGFSSRLAATALAKNRGEGRGGSLVLCDPQPPSWARPGILEIERVVTRRAQDLDLQEFTNLAKDDFLFIDSSHVLAVGSDVQYLFLDVLPALAPGVLVHVHDVFLPAEYPRYWVRDRLRFWNEQHLLQAFLAFNASFRVVWASHYMALTHPDRLEQGLPSFRRGTAPGSFWIERVS